MYDASKKSIVINMSIFLRLFLFRIKKIEQSLKMIVNIFIFSLSTMVRASFDEHRYNQMVRPKLILSKLCSNSNSQIVEEKLSFNTFYIIQFSTLSLTLGMLQSASWPFKMIKQRFCKLKLLSYFQSCKENSVYSWCPTST